MASIAYFRVSSKDQNLDRQQEVMKAYSVDRVFQDKASGKNRQRPELEKMLAYVREGDTVYIASFDRLARSLSDLLYLVERFKEKKIKLVSVKENIDTGTSAGKLQLALFGAIAEFQREVTGELREEGMRIAKSKGVRFGRPPAQKPKGWDKAYKQWRAGEKTAVQTFNELGLTKSTFYKLVKTEKTGNQ